MKAAVLHAPRQPMTIEDMGNCGGPSVAVTMKYAHLAPDFMRDEISRLRFEKPPADIADMAVNR